jgi:hypothetical protein
VNWGAWFVVGLFVVAVAAAREARRRARELPPLVLLVGDSLAQGLGPPLTRSFAARGVKLESVAVQGSSARDWRREFLRKALERSQARLVLVSLGTNDSASLELAEEFPSNVSRLAEALGGAKRDVLWLVPPKATHRVRWTLEQPQFEALEPPAGLRLDATGHPLGDGYARWAAAVDAAFPTA